MSATDATATADAGLDPAIAAAALVLAEAELAAAAAAASLCAAESTRDDLRTKLRALDAKRRAVGSRRAAGDVRTDDAGELALVAADHEALAGIMAQHDAEVTSAHAAAQQATCILDAKKHALARVEAEREATELKRHADILAELLEKALDAMRDMPRLPSIRPWGPAEALVTKLTMARFYASV